MSFVKNITQRTSRKLLLKYAPPEILTLLRHLQSQNGQVYQRRNLEIVNSVSDKSVLVLAPHPDDEAIGLGGALSIYLENQCRVTVLYMTNGGGEGGTDQELIEIRRKEAESLSNNYRIKQIFWDIKDTCLTNDMETVSAMTQLLEDLQPNAIFLPSFFEHHFDHFAANQVLVDALKNKPSIRASILGYEVKDNLPFPNYIVDISSCFEKKADILSHYVTPLQTADFIELCRLRNALNYKLYIRGSRIPKPGYAEAFYRLDAKTYTDLYENFFDVLRINKSELPNHLVNHL